MEKALSFLLKQLKPAINESSIILLDVNIRFLSEIRHKFPIKFIIDEIMNRLRIIVKVDMWVYDIKIQDADFQNWVNIFLSFTNHIRSPIHALMELKLQILKIWAYKTPSSWKILVFEAPSLAQINSFRLFFCFQSKFGSTPDQILALFYSVSGFYPFTINTIFLLHSVDFENSISLIGN